MRSTKVGLTCTPSKDQRKASEDVKGKENSPIGPIFMHNTMVLCTVYPISCCKNPGPTSGRRDKMQSEKRTGSVKDGSTVKGQRSDGERWLADASDRLRLHALFIPGCDIACR